MCDMSIPRPAVFREWVIKVKEVLGISSYVWSIEAGIAQNGLSKFIAGKQRDLRLETASMLVAYARKLAKEKGVELPSLSSNLGNHELHYNTIEAL